MAEDIRLVERRFGEQLLTPLLERAAQEVNDAKVREYLTEVKEHILDNLDDFKESEQAESSLPYQPSYLPYRPVTQPANPSLQTYNAGKS